MAEINEVGKSPEGAESPELDKSPASPGEVVAEAPATKPPAEPLQAVATDEVEDQKKPGGGSSAADAEDQPAAQPDAPAPPADLATADDVLSKKMPGHAAADALVLAESRKHTRRTFAVAALSAAAGFGFYRWLPRSPEDMETPELLRRTLQANAAISRTVFDERALAPTYPLARAEVLRVNGIAGLKQALVPESWRLQVVGSRDEKRSPRFSKDVTAWEYRYTQAASHEDQGHDTKVAPSADTAEKMAPLEKMNAAKQQQERVARPPRGQEEAGESDSTLDPGTSGLLLTLDDVTRLPRHELVTQFKCIEGWSQIVHWAGVRMADFLELYPPDLIDGKEPRYVYMETPNGDYYTGYDMHVMRHPQTLLVTEMMGVPLTQFHGAPLRLHMPTKYGYKQIKRIGLISYTNDKPDDYWTKLGYDWYAGL